MIIKRNSHSVTIKLLKKASSIPKNMNRFCKLTFVLLISGVQNKGSILKKSRGKCSVVSKGLEYFLGVSFSVHAVGCC